MGGWSNAWRSGVNPNNPLTAVATAIAQTGTLPPVHSFLNVSAPLSSVSQAQEATASADIWVTAVKKQDGDGNVGLAVRLFGVNSLDQPNVTLQLNVGSTLAGASTSDLIELNPVPIPGIAGGTTVSLDVGYWSIETLILDIVGVEDTEG